MIDRGTDIERYGPVEEIVKCPYCNENFVFHVVTDEDENWGVRCVYCHEPAGELHGTSASYFVEKVFERWNEEEEEMLRARRLASAD